MRRYAKFRPVNSNHYYFIIILLDMTGTTPFILLLCAVFSCTWAAMTQADRDTALNNHNAERKAIGIPLLTYNLTIEASAQAVADTCVFKHSGGDYGENIYAGGGSFGTMASAVSAWMSEKSDWTCSSNKCSATCGHYTQIVWANSLRLGCGLTNCGGSLGTFIVCQYDPPGNYVGEAPFDTALCGKTQTSASTTYTTAASMCSALSLLGLVF